MYPVDERLKVKAGLPANKDAAGLIPAARIEKAQQIIEKSSDLMNAEFGRIMKEMTALYNGMTISKSMNHDDVRANQLSVSKMRHRARNIREMTETYNQSLVYDISKELYSFCRVMNSERVESYTILKGYLDTLNISYARKLSDRNSPAALELKRIINKAVSQYA